MASSESKIASEFYFIILVTIGVMIIFSPNPTIPINPTPIKVNEADFFNSILSGLWQLLINERDSLQNLAIGSATSPKLSEGTTAAGTGIFISNLKFFVTTFAIS